MKNFYHYTNLEGFEGIINNKSIRMTESDFLNDPDDCQLFVELVNSYLETHQKLISDSISKINSNKEKVSNIYNKCNLIDYIRFIHKNINLYVFSMTEIDDYMSFWNNYGYGGMELEFSIGSLINSIKRTFTSEKEFLTYSHVIYANKELDVNKIKVPNFSKFKLINNKSKNLFKEHQSFIDNNSDCNNSQLYSTSSLDTFIDTYLNSFLHSLKHLLNNKKIDEDMDSDEIFKEVFKNDWECNDKLFWKRDLTLYMIVLSVLIKCDTYKYENEHRIVYFEYNINSDNNKKSEEYAIKHIFSGEFIYPYITFENLEMLKNSLKSITISPISSNLPFNKEVYKSMLKKYLSKNGFDSSVDVKFSKHNIRW